MPGFIRPHVIAVGLFYDEDRMDQWEIDRLGAEVVALTYGSPTAFLSGVCWPTS